MFCLDLKKIFILILFVLFCSPAVAGQQSLNVSLSTPHIDWSVVVDIPLVEMTEYNISENEENIELKAQNQIKNLYTSVKIEKATKKFDKNEDCAQYYYEKDENLIPNDDYHNKIYGYVTESITPDENDDNLETKDVHVYIAKKDYCVDFYIKKEKFNENQQPFINEIVKSVNIRKKDLSFDSFIYMSFGDNFYEKGKYINAISNYEAALQYNMIYSNLPSSDIARIKNRLSMSFVYMDNLSVAKKMLEGYSSENPDLPMYYYNLARVCSKQGDYEGTVKYLKKARAHKNKIIADKKLPDIKKDVFFEDIAKNKKLNGLFF
jgi:tetratricopeptide (TPR) repeat protein